MILMTIALKIEKKKKLFYFCLLLWLNKRQNERKSENIKGSVT
jgi:hypothetical protein